MAEPVLAAACVSTDGGPEAVLVGADTTSSHRDVDASRTTTAPGYGQRSPAPRRGHAVTGNAPLRKKARSLEPQASIETKENFRRRSVVKQNVLTASSVKNDALPNLAAEHLQHFRDALGTECTRRLAPNRVIRVATSCTGSGAEVFTLLAIVEAFRTSYPGLRLSYVFHCEKNSTKRRFVQTLHEHLRGRLEQDEPPCFSTT